MKNGEIRFIPTTECDSSIAFNKNAILVNIFQAVLKQKVRYEFFAIRLNPSASQRDLFLIPSEYEIFIPW